MINSVLLYYGIIKINFISYKILIFTALLKSLNSIVIFYITIISSNIHKSHTVKHCIQHILTWYYYKVYTCMYVFLIKKITYHYIEKCRMHFFDQWFDTTERKQQNTYMHIFGHTCIYFIMCTLYYNCKICTRGIWKVHALAIYLLNAFIKLYKSIHFLKEQFNVDSMVYFLSVYVPTILLQIDRFNTM